MAPFAAATAGALAAALVFTMLLAVKAVRDYTTTGPMIPREIVAQFRGYAAFAVARLAFWAFLLAVYWALVGVIVMICLEILFGWRPGFGTGFVGGAMAITAAVSLRFASTLLFNPGVIIASSHYRISRFYPLWHHLGPGLFQRIRIALALAAALILAATLAQLAREGEWAAAAMLTACVALLLVIAFGVSGAPKAQPAQARKGDPARPNILMIGCDTLRADRLGVAGNDNKLTPRMDALAAQGSWFGSCYVPCGRTAPSLASLLTGTWPQTHGIRDNFVADDETRLKVPALPSLLAAAGYRTAAISDWCGADLGKFNFGFQHCDLPQDSWNLRYLLRQGPKDLRLFLSLFLRNRFGKWLLPELYYLGGVPSTELLGQDLRAELSRLASDDRPFLVNAFFSTTHPPFASEYPYYTRYADPEYAGPSKFAMARLTDPFEIIRRQGEPRREFDLDQILALYDGCVKRFDDEVGRILDHLEACGLADSTIIVIYSDHGMEFFEHDTWGQGNSVRGDHSARIPLIIRDPRQPGGNRIDAIVRSVDIAPTLLELAGQSIPGQMEGVSLAKCLSGAAPPTLPAYNESGIWLTDLPGMPVDHLRYPSLFDLLEVPDKASGTLAIKPIYRKLINDARDRMIRLGNWKLTYQPLDSGARYQLFDIHTDPGCRNDVAAMHPEVVAELAATMEPWIAGSPS
ncbi:MAG TPA: sulfatase [Rhodocyclaceae bacterium]|nr:sulfatase [Rhodocyclaceae bacterium]